MTRGRRAVVGLISGWLALTVSFQAARAAAQNNKPRIKLEWNAPTACPPRAEVIAEAQRLLRAEGESSKNSVNARADVVRTESGDWRLTLEVSQPVSARRSLIGEDCTAVAHACALLLAMTMAGPDGEALPSEEPAPAEEARPADDEHSRSSEGPPPAHDEDPESQKGPPPPEPGFRNESSAFLLDLNGSLGLRAALELGALPSPSPGVGVTGEVAWRIYSLRTWLGAYLPSTTGIESVRGAEATFLLAEGTLHGCVMPRLGPVGLGPCLGAAAGVLWAKSSGVAAAESSTQAWIAPLAMLALKWPSNASGLAMEAAAGVAWALRRPRFMLRRGGPIHQPSPISLRVQLGASWQL